MPLYAAVLSVPLRQKVYVDITMRAAKDCWAEPELVELSHKQSGLDAEIGCPSTFGTCCFKVKLPRVHSAK